MTNAGDMFSQTPDGALAFSSPGLGVWEPISERGVHFTFTATNYDATGMVLGTTTVDGYPVASEDGMSFWDDGTMVTLTIRDPNGAITQVLGPGLPGAAIGGTRMVAGNAGYEAQLVLIAAHEGATPEAGTPTS